MMITAVSTRLRCMEAVTADLNADGGVYSLCKTGGRKTGNMFTRYDNIRRGKQRVFGFFKLVQATFFSQQEVF